MISDHHQGDFEIKRGNFTSLSGIPLSLGRIADNHFFLIYEAYQLGFLFLEDIFLFL